MTRLLDKLVRHLSLEPIEENLFRGQSVDLGWGRVYGGQVLGQALAAAVQTVPGDRHVHSLHGYFLRPGDVSRPIVYNVDRIRDGRSFTTRRVVAIQKGEAIFNMAASFQGEEPGLEHQDAAPDVPGPEELVPEEERLAAFADRMPEALRKRALAKGPIDVRAVDPVDDPFRPSKVAPSTSYWLKTRHELPDDPALHQYMLAYLSDWGFLATSLRPHGITWLSPRHAIASLDHAMWFHRPFRVDEWLLYATESPIANGSRSLVRGHFYDQAGRLVVSTIQEGLIRERKPRPEKP